MCLFNLTQRLADIQNNLSKEIIFEDDFKDIKKVAGADISFSKNNIAIAAAVIINYDTLEIIEMKILKVELIFPYISGFLGFRESYGIISVLKTLQNNFDVLIINGHGALHPRGFGLASHVGLLMDIPTIGVAKRLIGRKNRLKDNSLIEFNGNPIGSCSDKKCISVGHKISLQTAIHIADKMSIFKIPEPIRQAHILATATMKRKL